MINKHFFQDWKIYNGEINVINSNHFSLDIDKDYASIGISISWKFRLILINLLHIVLRWY